MCGSSLDLVAQAVLPSGPEQPPSLDDVMNRTCTCGNPQPQSQSNEITIYKSNVLTMARGKFNPAEAFAVRNGIIISVGTLAEVTAAVGEPGPDSQMQVVDYSDKFIMPGFVEPHMHLLLSTLVSIPNYLLDFSYPNVKTLDDALGIVKDSVAAGKPDNWVFGFGYDPSLVKGHGDLTLTDLDAAAPRNPVYVVNQSGHVGYVNTLGFTKAGIGIKAGEPGYPAEDGNYVKDEASGVLTGILLEDAVKAMVAYVPQRTPEQVVASGRDVLKRWAGRGITTAYDCGIGSQFGMYDLALLKDITTGAPDLLPRFRGALVIQSMEKLIPYLGVGLAPPPWQVGGVNVYGIKLWLDGSTQGLTAALNEPYLKEKDNYGVLNYRKNLADVNSSPDDAKLLSLIQPFMSHGWQIVCHTNGARALEMALRVYARAFASISNSHTAGMMRRHMHRLEHVTADVTQAHLDRAASLGLGVSHLIAHVRRWGHAFESWVLGRDRAAHVDPVKDSVESGATYSFHSDSPVSDADPLQFVETAVEREMEESGRTLGPRQKIEVEEAFAGVTINPATQLGAQNEIGSLEWGKKADFVVLDKDPRKARHVTQVKVLETRIGGMIAFKESE